MDLRPLRYRARIRRRAIAMGAPSEALLSALDALDAPAVLESSAAHDAFGRYSLFACQPIETLTARSQPPADPDSHDDPRLAGFSPHVEDVILRDSAGTVLATTGDSLWPALEGAFASISVASDDAPHAPPYVPGWIGYVGYEIGRTIERLPCSARRDTGLPDLRLAFYDALLIYDAHEHAWTLTELVFEGDAPAGAGQAAQTLAGLTERVAAAQAQPPRATEHADASHRPLAAATPNFTAEGYCRAVQQCIDYIAAGDIFQVNLSQRMVIEPSPRPMDLYRVLRRRNPAWYAAYLAFDRCAIVSSSPELFLRVRGRQVVTRPIKGTRPRSGDEVVDAIAREQLCSSPKDNAELAMIIDLLRNDLGRVCRAGSIRVIEPRRLETHPTVYHLVGTVAGELAADVGPAALLRATFPGGSITGAPKIRAMEIIDELEPTARGMYCGCIGIVGADGSAEWNIAIRTIVCEGERALVQAGGGIVADSEPIAEYLETLHKARALLEAIHEAQQLGS